MGCCCSKKTSVDNEPSLNLSIHHGQITTPETTKAYVVSPGPNFKAASTQASLVLDQEVQLPAERNACNITDSSTLEGGEIVLCDQRNGKLFLYDSEFKYRSEVTLDGLPYKITDIPWRVNRVAVSILSGNRIRYLNINNGIFQAEELVLHTESKCRGIDSSNEKLIYTMENSVVSVSLNNSSLKSGHSVELPVSLSTDRDNDVVYVLCESKTSTARIVKIRLPADEKDFDMTYSNIRNPVSMCVDNQRNIYVCTRDPPSISKLSPKGMFLGTVLVAKFGLFQHIQFLKSANMIMLTKPNTNKVWLYNVE